MSCYCVSEDFRYVEDYIDCERISATKKLCEDFIRESKVNVKHQDFSNFMMNFKIKLMMQ